MRKLISIPCKVTHLQQATARSGDRISAPWWEGWILGGRTTRAIPLTLTMRKILGPGSGPTSGPPLTPKLIHFHAAGSMPERTLIGQKKKRKKETQNTQS